MNTKTYGPDDMKRLQDSQEEINDFREFVKTRAAAWLEQSRDPDTKRASYATVRVPDPLTVHDVDGVECIHARLSLGGDQFGESFHENYVPLAAIFSTGTAEQDASDYETYLRLKEKFES